MNNYNNEFNMKDLYDFSNGIRGRFYSPIKKSITIMLDDDVILFFKKKTCEQKIDYQTLINSTLIEQLNRKKADKKTGEQK